MTAEAEPTRAELQPVTDRVREYGHLNRGQWLHEPRIELATYVREVTIQYGPPEPVGSLDSFTGR